MYRDSLREASDRLHLANARLEADGEPLDGAVGEHADGTVALRGTLVNQGDAGDGVVRLVFYDGDGTATWKVESRQFGVDAGERRDLDMRVYVPADAAYCDVTALDAADPETATL
ncbi:hypothetical protein ACFQRB_15645 [Halobaculum litoreum]|uniref:CARDB domain-containing protein n=1 Tax=Halobaculum litoreum TaxID=3031998 RepID=A0ABD5XWB3_9EURY